MHKRWPSNRCKTEKQWLTSALLALANIDHIFTLHTFCRVFQLLIIALAYYFAQLALSSSCEPVLKFDSSTVDSLIICDRRRRYKHFHWHKQLLKWSGVGRPSSFTPNWDQTQLLKHQRCFVERTSFTLPFFSYFSMNIYLQNWTTKQICWTKPIICVILFNNHLLHTL